MILPKYPPGQRPSCRSTAARTSAGAPVAPRRVAGRRVVRGSSAPLPRVPVRGEASDDEGSASSDGRAVAAAEDDGESSSASASESGRVRQKRARGLYIQRSLGGEVLNYAETRHRVIEELLCIFTKLTGALGDTAHLEFGHQLNHPDLASNIKQRFRLLVKRVRSHRSTNLRWQVTFKDRRPGPCIPRCPPPRMMSFYTREATTMEALVDRLMITLESQVGYVDGVEWTFGSALTDAASDRDDPHKAM